MWVLQLEGGGGTSNVSGTKTKRNPRGDQAGKPMGNRGVFAQWNIPKSGVIDGEKLGERVWWG